MLSQLNRIFKAGSKTYYYSSLLFPPDMRKEVAVLYAFVRSADNFVDQIPQDAIRFYAFKEETLNALKKNKPPQNPIIQQFLLLAEKRSFKIEWIEAFLDAMEADLHKNKYNTFAELEQYMYGSAEVVGLMMCNIMQLSEKSFEAAQKLGKAMQLINFVRDIKEDIELGRQYIPQTDLDCFGIKNLQPKTVEEKQRFNKLIEFEITRYLEIVKEAEEGFVFIPRQYLISIKTASDMYKWTAKEILHDPTVVFRKKVKPPIARILFTLLINSHNSCPLLNTPKLSVFLLPTI